MHAIGVTYSMHIGPGQCVRHLGTISLGSDFVDFRHTHFIFCPVRSRPKTAQNEQSEYVDYEVVTSWRSLLKPT